MQLVDLVKRVQAALEDPDGTYMDDDYCKGHVAQQYDLLYNKLRLTSSGFDVYNIQLPNVTAGIPNLDQYMAAGQPLANLVLPQMVEWKLPGLDPVNYQRIDGPLDYLKDVQNQPFPASWTFLHRSIALSSFTANVDLRITGEFLFDPLTEESSVIAVDVGAGCVLVYMVALAIAEARGNPSWIERYDARMEDAWDDLFIAMTRANQAIPRRLARMSRRVAPGLSGNLSR